MSDENESCCLKWWIYHIFYHFAVLEQMVKYRTSRRMMNGHLQIAQQFFFHINRRRNGN